MKVAERHDSYSSTISSYNTNAFGLFHMDGVSIQASWTATTYAAKTFTDASLGGSGELITITAHGFQSGIIVRATTSTTLPTGISAGTDYWVIVVDANTIALASSFANFGSNTRINITDDGAGTHTLTPVVRTFTNSSIVPNDETITITAHGFTDGVVVQATTDDTLPTGLAAATDYWVIVVDANTIKLASSFANFGTETAIDITDDGAGTHTLTPVVRTFTDAEITDVSDEITITAHGWSTGLEVQATSSGTLPTGISLATNYYVIRVDANTIQLAASLLDAQGGTEINFSADGSGTHTLTPTDTAQDFQDTDLDAIDTDITITAHGWSTGLPVQATTSGSLPTGLALATTYYVIRVDANTIRLATSALNATNNVPIELTPDASGTQTLTPTATAKTFDDADLDVDDYEITISAHGFVDGLAVQGTTTGTLPGNMSLATNYYVIVVDANTISLATSRALALAGTAMELLPDGSGTHTLTAVALAGTMKLQGSNNAFTGNTSLEENSDAIWEDISNTSANITGASGAELYNITGVYFNAIRASVTATTGDAEIEFYFYAKGQI